MFTRQKHTQQENEEANYHWSSDLVSLYLTVINVYLSVFSSLMQAHSFLFTTLSIEKALNVYSCASLQAGN